MFKKADSNKKSASNVFAKGKDGANKENNEPDKKTETELSSASKLELEQKMMD